MRLFLLPFTVSVCLAQTPSPEKLIEEGHWKRARLLVEARLRENPEDANSAFLSSQIRNAFGDRNAPLGFAEKAVQLDGGVARYHRQLAEVQGLLAQRANLFQQVGLARRFRKELDAALALDPRDPQALRDQLEYYLLAPGLVGGDVKKAEAMAPQIAAVDTVEGFLAKARLAEHRKDYRQMEAMLLRAVETRPPVYKAYATLAQYYLAPEHRSESAAETWAKEAVALESGRIAGYSVLASVYAGRSDEKALETVLARAGREVADDATPYYRAAERLLADNRDVARAERYLRLYLTQEAEGNQPTAADAHWKLGLALRVLGKEGDAAREWKTALELDPESPAAGELKRVRNAGVGGATGPAKNGGAN